MNPNMKIASLTLGHDVIEAHNNMLTGTETVVFNGQEVSRQFNVFSGTHRFEVLSADGSYVDVFRVEFRMSLAHWKGVAVDIFRNDECLLDQTGSNYRTRANELPRVARSRNRARRSAPQASPTARRQPLYRREDLV